jgi:hypothetical protein
MEVEHQISSLHLLVHILLLVVEEEVEDRDLPDSLLQIELVLYQLALLQPALIYLHWPTAEARQIAEEQDHEQAKDLLLRVLWARPTCDLVEVVVECHERRYLIVTLAQ